MCRQVFMWCLSTYGRENAYIIIIVNFKMRKYWKSRLVWGTCIYIDFCLNQVWQLVNCKVEWGGSTWMLDPTLCSIIVVEPKNLRLGYPEKSGTVSYLQYSSVNRSVKWLTKCIQTCPSTRPHGDFSTLDHVANLIYLELRVWREFRPRQLEQYLH